MMKFPSSRLLLAAFGPIVLPLLAHAQPVINSLHPPVLTQRAGDRAAYVVSATGSGTLTYQWYRNGTALAGQTTSALVLTNLQPSSAGQYGITVTDDSLAIASNHVTLNISADYLWLYPTNLIVARVGDGVQTLSRATGNTLFLDQYTPAGAYVSTIQIPDENPGSPTNGSSRSIYGSPALLVTGAGDDANYEALLTASPDQQYLNFAGYALAYPFNGTDATSSTGNGGTIWRGIYSVNGLGFYSLAYTNTGLYSGGNHTIRAAASLDGTTNFWTTGQAGAGGIKYVNQTVISYATGSGIPTVNSSGAGTRVVQIVNGYLVFSDWSGSGGSGLYVADGIPQPPAGANSPSALLLPEGGHPVDFAFSPDGRTAYIADDQNFAGSSVQAGGIQRWDTNEVSGGFSYSYTLPPTAGTAGALALLVSFPPEITAWGTGVTGAVVYATSADPSPNVLSRVIDNGPDSTPTPLVTAGPRQLLRGVRFGPSIIAPVVIAAQPLDQTNFIGKTATFGVSAGGAQPYFYQWQFNGVNLPGATNATLVLTNLQPENAGGYSVIVSNVVSSAASDVATLTVHALPEILGQTPATDSDVTLYSGANPGFSVSADGAVPLSYYWFTNGTPVGSATGSRLVLSNVQAGFSAYVVVSNSAGAVTSAVWNASVIAPPGTPYPQAVLAAHPLGYWPLNETDTDGFNNGVIAHDYVGANNGFYTNTVLGQPGRNPDTDPAATSALFGWDAFTDNNVDGITSVDFAAPTNTSAAFSIEAWVNGYPQSSDAGIVSKGYGSGGEQFLLDTGSDSIATHGFRFLVRDAAGATHGVNSAIAPSLGTWHHLVGVCDEFNGVVTFYIDGLAVGTAPIASGSGILSSTRPVLIGSRPANIASASHESQFAGYVSDVAIYNYALSAGQVAFQYAQSGVPPTFVQTPTNSVSTFALASLTLPAVASGTPTIGYVWSDLNNGADIASGTSSNLLLDASLSISSVPVDWNGHTLQLTVTNAFGSVSAYVSLQVLIAPPVITNDLPATVALPAGKAFTYAIGANGAQPISYQWYRQGALLPGQTTSTLPVTGGNPGDSATYQVVLTNLFGTATSSVSVVTSFAAPTGAYASNVFALNAAGYWPLQETSLPSPTAIETNYGTLGAVANAFYAATNEANVTFNQPGALNGDSDPSVYFNSDSFTSQTITNVNSYAFVPRTDPRLTLRPPLSLEAWVNSSFQTFGDLFGEGGGTGVNAPSGGGNYGGIRLSWSGTASGAALNLYVANGKGTTRNLVASPNNSLSFGQWHHVVATYDGTTVVFYIDGAPVTTNSTALAGANTLAPDTWSPFVIGAGFWQNNAPARGFNGTLDEVAVYTNILTAGQVSAHYAAGTGGGNYFNTILGDAPLLYYRLNAAGFTNPPASLNPPALNFGAAPATASYQRGLIPGGLAGPTNAVLSGSLAAPFNGVFSAIDAGYDAAFDPAGHQPFSVAAWFKGNPADGRVQSIVSHGATNWALNLDGTTGRVAWNLNNAGQLASTGILNDGRWHFVAGVYDGANSLLYVDGQLDKSAAASAPLVAEPGAHVYLGGNSDFTLSGNNERFLAGALSQVAYFTNALTAEQIGILYANPAPTPVISLSTSGDKLVIEYTGILLSSTNAAGPFLPVAGAASPYIVQPVAGQQFYRSRNP